MKIVKKKRQLLKFALTALASSTSIAGWTRAAHAASNLLQSEAGAVPPAHWRERIIWKKALPLHAPVGHYPGFRPSRTVLKAGTTYAKGGRALTVDIVKDQDVAVRMRDGTTIYVDVFRPAQASGVLPTVIAWSPYGKGNGGNQHLEDFPMRAGVPEDAVSGLQAWEAPDPAWWCAQGYAVINADARGAYSSEGNIAVWGTQEGQDGHDLIEWVATQAWSNKKVGMAGNSWLAIVQWFIAAERPRHLAAIAPWEGLYDGFRSNFPGGVIDRAFPTSIMDIMVGKGSVEDLGAMANKYPAMNAYWEDKVARVERIDVPAYVVGSWTNIVHTPGTFDAWERLASSEKWLRVHNAQEWSDFYKEESQRDLLRFFDRYLKGEQNGWETTPKVRLAVLGGEGRDELNRPMPSFPPADFPHVKRFLEPASQSLTAAPATKAKAIPIKGPQDSVSFELPLQQDGELIGFSKLRLWIQLHEGTDQDIHVALERTNSVGLQIADRSIPLPNAAMEIGLRWLQRTGIKPELGLIFPQAFKGSLRVSHRELDPAQSRPERPFLSHRQEMPVKPGDIFSVDIAIDPVALKLHQGETLRLRIAGRTLTPIPLEGLKHDAPRGSARFSIWCGEQYDSHWLVPMRAVA